jgi:hypothetical protein
LFTADFPTKSLQSPLGEWYIFHLAKEATDDAVDPAKIYVVLPQLLDQIFGVAVNMSVRRPVCSFSK